MKKSAIPQSHSWLQFTSIVEFLSLCILWKMISLMLSACCISAEDECAGAIKVGSFIQLCISYSFIFHTTQQRKACRWGRKEEKWMKETCIYKWQLMVGWCRFQLVALSSYLLARLLLKMHLRLVLNGMLGVISTKIDKNIFNPCLEMLDIINFSHLISLQNKIFTKYLYYETKNPSINVINSRTLERDCW